MITSDFPLLIGCPSHASVAMGLYIFDFPVSKHCFLFHPIFSARSGIESYEYLKQLYEEFLIKGVEVKLQFFNMLAKENF